MGGVEDLSIFLEFVVSVQDEDSLLFRSSSVAVEIPLDFAGHVTWCESESADTDVMKVANVDIVIGTASSLGQLDTQLTKMKNVLNGTEIMQSNANSLQSGLISLVLKGDDTYFGLPRAKDFYLELEDVVSVHFLETTNTKMDAVKVHIHIDRQ